MMEKALKIGLIGAAGLGKSSVATAVAKEKNLMFLKSKDITRPILKRDGYTYGRDECVELFLSKRERELELVDERKYAESLLSGGFITDRTTLECFCYALLNIHNYSNAESRMIETLCKENMSNYTHLFYFPQKDGWLEENGLRTTSVYFQWKIDMLIWGVLSDWNIEYKTIPKNCDAISFIKQNI